MQYSRGGYVALGRGEGLIISFAIVALGRALGVDNNLYIYLYHIMLENNIR